MPLLRADPGYIHWLEKQSVLGNAPDLARIVSGSGLMWRASATLPATQQALNEAGMWLFVDPQSLLVSTGEPTLRRLGQPETMQRLAQWGFSGVFVTHMAASGRQWQPQRAATRGDTDTTALILSPLTGSEDDRTRFALQAQSSNLLTGGDTLPLTTGLGPDFFLAIRAVRDWPGVYCLIDIPRTHWNNLPLITAPGADQRAPLWVAELAPEHLEALEAAGLVPRLVQDVRVAQAIQAGTGAQWTAANAGWAATGEIRGHDGETRRWIYRFYGDPTRPVLNWDDPSGAAKRMASASVIQEVGVRRMPLIGLSVDGTMGLEVATLSPDRGFSESKRSSENHLQPGITALGALARETRHYGGWSVLRDPFPLAMAPQLLRHGPEFIMDSVTWPSGEYALLTGDAGPLRAAFDTALSLSLDQSRLLRPLSSPLWLDFAALEKTGLAPLPSVSPSWGAVLATQRSPTHQEKIRAIQATVPALAAMRLGLNPDHILQFVQAQNREQASLVSQTQKATRTLDQKRDALVAMHRLLLTFRAGLPGLLAIAGQDLAGITHNEMPEADTAQSETFLSETLPSRPLPPWSLDNPVAPSTKGGLSRGVALYAPFMAKGTSAFTEAVPAGTESGHASSASRVPFTSLLDELSRVRQSLHIPMGHVVQRLTTTGKGSVAVAVRLSHGDMLLTAGNFSDSMVREELVLPTGTLSLGPFAWDALRRDQHMPVRHNRLTVTLAPYECRLLYLPLAQTER